MIVNETEIGALETKKARDQLFFLNKITLSTWR
jgi:hypothetical protein